HPALRRADHLHHRGQERVRRHPGPVPDRDDVPLPADVRQHPARLRGRDRLGDIPADPGHRARELHDHPARRRGAEMSTISVRTPGANRKHRGPERTNPATYGTLVVIALISAFPLYYMLVGASRTNDQIGKVPPPLLPGGNLLHNLKVVFANPDANIGTGLLNSFLAASIITVSMVFFCSLAGFAFAKLRFRGKNALLLIIIGAMMVP